MSPVSRTRKPKKQAAVQSAAQRRAATVDPAVFTPGSDAQLRALLKHGRRLAKTDDLLGVTATGATAAVTAGLAHGQPTDGFLERTVPRIEAAGGAPALAVLLAIGGVVPYPEVREALDASAGRLAHSGAPRPEWADALSEPVIATGFEETADASGEGVMLTCDVTRAGRRQTVMIAADLRACGAATSVMLLGEDTTPEPRAALRLFFQSQGVRTRATELDAEEFRFRAEHALDARAHHDNEQLGGGGSPNAVSEKEHNYFARALQVRSYLAALPTPSRPPLAHGELVRR